MKKNNKWIKTDSILLYLSIRVFVALVAVWTSHLFFHYCTRHMFPVDRLSDWGGIVWGNVVFGLAAVCTVTIPYMILMLIPTEARWKRWYRILCESLYFLPVSALVIAKCIDAVYFPFTYRLMSGEVFAYLGIGGDMGNLTWLFIRDYWYVAIGILMSMTALIFLCTRIELRKLTRKTFVGAGWVSMAIGVAFAVVFARGGFGRCISLKDAGKYVEPKYSALVVNSGYSILRTLCGEHLEAVDYMSDEDAQSLFNPEFKSIMYQTPMWDFPYYEWGMGGHWATIAGEEVQAGGEEVVTLSDEEHYSNIVILMMESFSQEYMGCYNHGLMPSRTPFLDSLAQHSKVFQGRSNGKKSIESLAAVTASIPTLMEMPFTMSEYAEDSIVGLPQILAKYGFTSTFYHGGYNGTMAFDKFCKRVGFDHYIGMDEYLADGGDPKGYDNAWGIYDEPFMQYAVHKMGEVKEPFFNMLFSISSHHPYSIPEEHKDRFAKGEKPLLPCIEYSDMALRKFFDEARKTDWYENTLFVILADHPGTCIDPSFNNYQGWYSIPMIFYSPRGISHSVSDDIVQQIDIMPTIVDYLCLGERFVCFGNSIFQRERDGHGYQVAYGNGWYVLNYPGGSALVEGGTERGDHEKVQLLKAIVQQYNHRLCNNQLTIKK